MEGRMHMRTQLNKPVTSQEPRPDLPNLLVLEVLLWRWGAAVTDGGDKDIEGGCSGEYSLT